MKKVLCKKLGQELEALENKPFDGELGEEIFENISKKAWDMWNDDMMIKVINEYRLNMVDPKDHEKLLEQMRIFLNLDSGEVLEVENEDRGKN